MVIKAKEKFVTKLVNALQQEDDITSVIGSTKINPNSNLLLRFVKGVNAQYKTTANKMVLEEMLRSASSNLYRLQMEKATGPITSEVVENYITIEFNNGVLRPRTWPTNPENFQWELKTNFQSWSPIGSSGANSIFPEVAEGNIRLTYEKDTNVRSNVISIQSVIKRQIGSTKRKPFRFNRTDTEFVTRCTSVASRILRLCNPRILGTPFNMEGSNFSMRIFEDRVSRLPKHLDTNSEEILKLCYASNLADNTFIRMVEFCEPTIYLNPEGRRREIREISAGNRLELRLSSESAAEIKEQNVAAITVSAEVKRSKQITKSKAALRKREQQVIDKANATAAAALLSEQNEEKVDKAEEIAIIAEKEQQDATELRIEAEKQKREAEIKQHEEELELLRREQEEEQIESDRRQAEEDVERLKKEKRIEERMIAQEKVERLKQEEEKAKSEGEKAKAEKIKADDDLKNAKEAELERERIEQLSKDLAIQAKKKVDEANAAKDAAEEAAQKVADEAAVQKQKQIDAWEVKVDKLQTIDRVLIKEKFDALDADGDQEISITELAAAYQSSSKGQKLKSLVTSALALKVYDSDGDNHITLSEFEYWCVDSNAVKIWATEPIYGYVFALKRPEDGEVVYFKNIFGTWERRGRENFFLPYSVIEKYKVTGKYINNHWVQVKTDEEIKTDEETDEEVDEEVDEEADRSPPASPPASPTATTKQVEETVEERLSPTNKQSKREAKKQEWDTIIENFSIIDLALIGQKFKGLDKNNDGTINITELREAYEASNVKAREVWKIIDKFDKDKSGSIGLLEFKYWVIDSNSIKYWANHNVDGYLKPKKKPTPANNQEVVYKGMEGTWIKPDKFKPKNLKNSDIYEDGDDKDVILQISDYNGKWLQIKPRRSVRKAAAASTDSNMVATSEATEANDELDAAILSMQNSQIPSGDLTSMVANMSDDWAESDEELNFAEESDTGETGSMEFAESSQQEDSGSMEFAESSQQEDSGSMEFAESSSVETDSDAEPLTMRSESISSEMEFAESSAIESESDKVSSEAPFAESSDYE